MVTSSLKVQLSYQGRIVHQDLLLRWREMGTNSISGLIKDELVPEEWFEGVAKGTVDKRAGC